jgi:hypothetical protein
VAQPYQRRDEAGPAALGQVIVDFGKLASGDLRICPYSVKANISSSANPRVWHPTSTHSRHFLEYPKMTGKNGFYTMSCQTNLVPEPVNYCFA